MSSKSIITINDQPITEKDVMQGIDNVLVNLNDTGDLAGATKVLNALDTLNNVTGKAKAKLLWGMQRWYAQVKPEEEFSDYIESTTTTKKVTVDRYVSVWTFIDNESIPKAIQKKPMRELVPIANMLKQGFDPSKREWEKIELASNPSELGEVIRKIKKKKARKSKIRLEWDREGSLYLWKENVRKYVGFLVRDGDKDVEEAIERILSGANIIRK